MVNRVVLRFSCHLVSSTTLHLLSSRSSISFFKPGLFFLGIPHIVLTGIGNKPRHIYLYQVSGHAAMSCYLNTESCSSMKHLSTFDRVYVSILHQKILREIPQYTFEGKSFYFLGKNYKKLGVPLKFLTCKALKIKNQKMPRRHRQYHASI